MYFCVRLGNCTDESDCRVFWNFKTEGSPEWDAFRLIDNGIFPQPLTDRKFGQICTN
jgi:hypothetical protein